MLVMLIISIYLIVTSLQELETLIKSASEYCFVAMKHSVLFSSLQNLSQIILYHCYPQFRKGKKSHPSHTSSASKTICLKLPKMERLASRFNKGKQSKL